MIRNRAVWFSLVLLCACKDAATEPTNPCGTVSLPLRGASNGPVITDIGLEVQTSGIVLVVTATDPQGTSNLAGVSQTAGVFPDVQCAGTALVLQDDLSGSGVEETFGTVVDASTNQSLFTAISNADRWPVTVDFRDVDGNRTTGKLSARVIK